jgi:ATP-dependent Lon protease
MPGVSTGLAWTSVGGELLYIEATKMSGSGNILLTGQLGDVMKESVHIALSWVKSQASNFMLSQKTYKGTDIHIHFPSASIPKDGPSAGVAIVTAIISLFTGISVKKNIAMTGEITLRGLVLPVGGIKEKVLAAHRAGISEVILPLRNKADLSDIPIYIVKKIKFIFVEMVTEALKASILIK